MPTATTPRVEMASSDLTHWSLVYARELAGESSKWVLRVHPYAKHHADKCVFHVWGHHPEEKTSNVTVDVHTEFEQYEWELEGQRTVHNMGA